MQKANVFRKRVSLTEFKPKLIARTLALPFQACAVRLVRSKSPDLFTQIVYSFNACLSLTGQVVNSGRTKTVDVATLARIACVTGGGSDAVRFTDERPAT